MALKNFNKTLCEILSRVSSGKSEVALDEPLGSIDEREMRIAQDFLDLVLKKDIQCLSQIQYDTGYSMIELRQARDLLVKQSLIEPIRYRKNELVDQDRSAYQLAI